MRSTAATSPPQGVDLLPTAPGVADRTARLDGAAGRGIALCARAPLLVPLAATLLVAVATFGLPVALGLSWVPTPIGLPEPPGRLPATGSGVDLWTFPHVEWPWRRLAAAALAEGRIPWWNPYLSLGAPLAGQLESQVFQPLELVEMFLGPLGWNVMLVLKVAVAGLGAYLLARRLGLDVVGGLVAAVGYELSAYFVWFNALPSFVNQALFVPWTFLGAALARDPRVNWRLGVGALGLGVGGLLLGGQPQIAALALLAIGVTEAVALALMVVTGRSLGRVPRSATRLAAGLLLGLGVAAIQLVLMRDAVSHAFTLHSEGMFGGAHTQSANFVNALAPYLFGQLNAAWDPAYFPAGVNWEAFPLTVGGAQLLLLVVGLGRLVLGRGPGLVPAVPIVPYAALFGVSFGIIVGESAGLSDLWGWGPTGRVNFPRYSTPVTALMVAVLVGWTVAGLRALSWRELFLANAAVALLAAGAASIALPLFQASSPSADPSMRTAAIWLGLVPLTLGLVGANVALVTLAAGRTTAARARVGLLLVLFAELQSFVRYGLSVDWDLVRLVVATLLVGSAVLVVARRDRLAVGLTLGALACQTGVLVAAPNRLARIYDSYAAEPPHIRFLREQVGEGSVNGRILGTRGHIQSNATSAFGIAELSALQPVQAESTSTYIRSMLGDEVHDLAPLAWNGMAEIGGSLSWAGYLERRPYYNALNVRYLVDAPDGPLSRRPVEGISLVYEAPEFRVYQDGAALPRAYTIDRAAAAEDVEDAIRRLRTPRLDPRSRVVVELQQDELPRRMQRAGGAVVRPAPVLRYAAEAVDLQVDADDPVLLVLADAYYPGWTATVDGQPTPIRRVNLALRGVVVPDGRHVVTFRYAPPLAREAQLASVVSVTVAVALVASGPVARRRRGSRPPEPVRAARAW